MRKKLEFGRAPVEMYLPGGSALSNTKCKTKVVLDHDAKDVKRLQHIAAQIRPETLQRAFRYFAGMDVSEIKDLLRGRKPLPPLRTGYFYHAADHGGITQASLYRNDTLLARGSTVELFCYAMQEHPGAARIIVDEVRSGGLYVPMSTRSDDLSEALLAYRQCRKHSKGLDKITKLAQLDKIDQDHVIMKFRFANYLDDSYSVVMLGSGPLGGTHLQLDYPITLVDPLIAVTGDAHDHYYKTKWQDYDFEGVDVVLSDVAAGTADGMTKGSTFQPPKDLDVLCLTKLDLQDDHGPRGKVVLKPRPHNTEVIYLVDDDGETWEKQLPQHRTMVRRSNEARMLNFFNLQGTSKEMPQSASVHLLNRLKNRVYLSPRWKKKSLKIGKTPATPDPLKGRRAKRFNKFCEFLNNFSWEKFEHLCADPVRWCLLDKDSLIEGGAGRLDPGIGTIEFSAHSVLLSARIHGFKVIKTGGGWILKSG